MTVDMQSASTPPARTLILLSDSTGDLGERFLRALISQFPEEPLTFRVFSFVRTPEELGRIVDRLDGARPVIFHTMLDPEMKRDIEAMSHKTGYPAYDLTGGAMAFFEKVLGRRFTPNPKALHRLSEAYDKRIDSIDFTVNHDDGMNPETLRLADIVLIGVSRVSKTPTSIFLANKGFRVANVPLVRSLGVPESLRRWRGGHVAGLMIQPEKLREIRLNRVQQDKIPGADYADLTAIRAELDWAHSLMLELGCPIVDVTYYAVEETAALVLKALRMR